MSENERASLKLEVREAIDAADYLGGSLRDKADRISNDIMDAVSALLAAERNRCLEICRQVAANSSGHEAEAVADLIEGREPRF